MKAFDSRHETRSAALLQGESGQPPLRDYQRKRDFRRTSEPAGSEAQAAAGDLYVMHKHAASHDHFDLRLEQDGVLRSWALPKGPSLQRGEKRLAIEVEDHPIEYGSFEGTIPKGEYGGGTVMLWDVGSWHVTGKCDDDQIDFALDGGKLQGRWTLVRSRPKPGTRSRNKQWLLIKRGEGDISPAQAHERSISSGRSMAEIARGVDPDAHDTPPTAANIAGARLKRMPETFAPQLATRADDAPEGEDWVHEIKFDGYRVVVHLNDDKLRLVSRNGLDWTRRFASQAEHLKRLAATEAILDGEMVALGADGASDFGALQDQISARDTGRLILQLFDLMYLDGHDLTSATLIERKAALQRLLRASGFEQSGPVRFSDHVVGNGPAFFQHACEMGLEGAMAKRADARYSSRRSAAWLKLKCTNHEEFLVGGFTRPAGARKGFGALLLGVRDGDSLRYAGRVGSGFSDRQLQELHARLRESQLAKSPFAEDVPDAKGASWVSPEVVVEVEFTERTREGRLRHPTFRGVREDREASEISVSAEPAAVEPRAPAAKASRAKTRPQDSGDVVEGIRITHPERIVYPEAGITKLELARFYAEIQDWLLPQLANRLLSLVRCPQGSHETCFFQKHLTASQAKKVPRQPFDQSGGARQYAYVQSIAHVIALVQAGVLEFHPFGSQVNDPEHPDLMVFDLDPSPGVPWEEIVRTARELRQRLDALKLASFVRTTGGKGIHVVVPLQPAGDWDEVKAFSKAFSDQLAADDPTHLTTILSKAKRRNKIFIDYLRNARGATAIASYSTRARPGAPVATPIRWDELNATLRPDQYTVANLPRRLAALKADPWGDFHDARVPISKAMRKAVGLQ